MTDNIREMLEHAKEMGHVTMGTLAKVAEIFGELSSRKDLSQDDMTRALLIVGGMATGMAIGDEVLNKFVFFAREKIAEGEDVPFDKSSQKMIGVGRDVYNDFTKKSSMIAHAIMDGITMAAQAQIEVMQAQNPEAPVMSDENKKALSIKAAQSFMMAFKLAMVKLEIPDPQKTQDLVRGLYEENNVSLHTN